MLIVFQNENQKERRLYVPNAVALNRVTSVLIARGLEKRGVHLAYAQIREFAECIKAVRKRHPDWVLLEAEPSNNEKIKIIV